METQFFNGVDDLELRTDNPYSIGEVLTIGTEVMLERTPIIYQKSPLDRQYEVLGNQKLTDIAFEAWGNSKLWWILDDVNDIENPFELEPGIILLIPDLDAVNLKLLE